MKKLLFNEKNILRLTLVLLKKIRKRFYGYLLEVCYKLKIERIPILPISIDIEPTNRCNFKCPHCQHTYWRKEHCDLSFSNFKKILTQFPNLNFLKIQGIGEPLLNKDFCKMLDYGESKYINLDFTTNGSIKSKSLLELINRLNRTQIRFSIDGVNENTYMQMRPEGKPESVIDYASQIIMERGNKAQPKIIFWMVLTKQNMNEVERLIKLAKRLGVDCVGLQTTLHDWAKNEVKGVINEISPDYCSDLYINDLAKTKKTADSLGIELIIESSLLSKKKKCKWPFTSTFIAANGDVVPCCWISDSDTMKMGNIYEENFETIWNSKSYIDLRNSIKKHQLKEYCKSCYLE